MALNLLPLSVDTDNIATLTLDQGKPVVVLDHELIQRLEATLHEVPRSVAGLILASASPRVFVAGADLKAISEMTDEALHKYLEYGSKVFGMLSDLPCPTAAVINGAALGGGLEIAMHCDGLVAAPPAPGKDGTAKPYPIGLPEAGLAICPGWGGTNLLPARIDPKAAILQTALGKPMLFDQAQALGLFDAVAPSPDQLLHTAKAWLQTQRQKPLAVRDGAPLRWIGRVSPSQVLKGLDAAKPELSLGGPEASGPALAVTEAVDIGLSQGWQAALACERRHLVKLRNQPAGKAAIGAFLAKSAKPA
jgi:enoyl-CoA hydratase/carnithine racemase